ncbi:MAG: cellulose synthase subunit BcsC-related outer membrane protein [Proteobacteria bacterium]|nr:cellulose synthase subunit BcsC-related outer membrane protein [Pseudomonadota bacterium]
MQINLRALSMALVLSGLISTPVFAASTTDVLLRGAKRWVDRDRSDLANNLLQKVILIEPDSPDALSMLGKIALKNGKHDEALAYLHTLQRTAPNDKRTQELSEAINGNPTAKITATPFFKTAKTEPVTKPGVVTAKAKQTKPARQSKPKPSPEEEKSNADEAAARLANDPDIIARTDALDALADGNTELAETSLLDIIKRRPNDPEVIGGLGLVHQKRGEFVESEKYFMQALAAAQAEKSETGRWESLIGTARFSQYMTNAKALLDENKLPEAEATVGQALALKPDDPDAHAVLGNIRTADNRFAEAEQLYREALKTEGYNVFAARGLANLLAKTGRSEEAIGFIEQVLQEYRSEWKKSPYSQASLLRAEAELHIEAHRPSRAMKALETAVEVDPKNPWVRYTLAKLYISLDLAPLARRVVQEGIALAPADPAMHQVSALVMMNLDDYAAAIDSLDQIPDESLTQDMRDTKASALIKYALQQADSKLSQGNRKEAIRILSIAETQAQNSYLATEQVAEAWFRLGQQKQGLAAMRKLPQPVPLETQVHFAGLLNRAKKDQELTDYLPSLRIPDGANDTNDKYRKTIQDIEFSMAGRQYDKLIKAGKKDEAQEFADNMLNANQLSSSDYFKYHRSYFTNAKLPEGAIPILNQEKEQNPDDLNIRYELAYAYHQEKQSSNAQRELKELIALTKSDDSDMRMRIASLQQELGDTSGSKQTLDDLIKRFPDNSEVPLQAGYIARSEGKYNQAMEYFELTRARSGKPAIPVAASVTAVTQAPPDILLNLLPGTAPQTGIRRSVAPTLASTSQSERIYRTALASDVPQEKTTLSNNNAANAEQAMDSIKATRRIQFETGLDIQSKNSTDGISTYNVTDIPMVARFPIGYEATGTVQVDQVNINAGTLAPVDSTTYGKGIQLAQGVSQKASDTSVGLAYEQGSVKADIGVIGLNFPVSNVVGGLRKSGNLGSMSYTLKFDRRPYTGSLVSYAGAIDPVSGAIWGGVTSMGPTLYLNTTLTSNLLGPINLSGMGSYWLVRGKNVLNNDRTWLRGVIDKDIYATDDMVLNLGFKTTYTGFSNNQGYYTFGHGGYYSPSSSLQFTIIPELIGRDDLLSYVIRPNVTYASVTTAAAPYFPNDRALQLAYGNQMYAGGSGNSISYGLVAGTEYRATPNIAFGANFNMDRSTYYNPTSLLLYLRYMLTPETGPVDMRPNPVYKYSQY